MSDYPMPGTPMDPSEMPAHNIPDAMEPYDGAVSTGNAMMVYSAMKDRTKNQTPVERSTGEKFDSNAAVAISKAVRRKTK